MYVGTCVHTYIRRNLNVEVGRRNTRRFTECINQNDIPAVVQTYLGIDGHVDVKHILRTKDRHLRSIGVQNTFRFTNLQQRWVTEEK